MNTFERVNEDVVEIDGKFYRVMEDEEHANFVWGKQKTPINAEKVKKKYRDFFGKDISEPNVEFFGSEFIEFCLYLLNNR